MSKIKYQPHIDGLRAIAVLSVLIFHINPAWLPGGFVGVDIFFVISGYLITSIIIRELDQKTFTIASFYTKRIKRILPLYFTVALFTLAVGVALFFPEDLVDLSKSLLASSLFVSNYYFWLTSGYFSSAVELKPLLHTWSLAVEEQFYIFWPLCLIVFFSPKFFITKTAGVVLILIVSLICSIVFSTTHPDFAYYSIFTRTYELMIGAVFSIYKDKLRRDNPILVIVSILVIFTSIIFIDKSVIFPGFIAVFPCVASGYLIVNASNSRYVNSFLSCKAMTSVGLISYSLYMWHWPILSFTKYYFFNPSAFITILSVLTIFFISILSRRYIEQPFIKSKMLLSRTTILLYVVPTSFIFLATLIILNTNGLISRYDETEQIFINSAIPSPKICNRSTVTSKTSDACIFVLKDNKQKKKLLIWGDSHANHLYGFAEVLSQRTEIEIEVIPFAGCPPIIGVYRINRSYSEHCYNHNNMVWKRIQNKDFDIVMLAANWPNYSLGDNLADQVDMTRSTENSNRAFYFNLDSMLKELKGLEQKTWFLEALPNFQADPKRCHFHNQFFSYSLAPNCKVSVEGIEKKRSEYNEFILENVKNESAIYYYTFFDFFCDEKDCIAMKNNNLYFSDRNHLSYKGSQSLAEAFLLKIDKLER